MEFGLVEALVLIGVILIVGILADGYRRKLASRKAHQDGAWNGERAADDFDLLGNDVGVPRVIRRKAEESSEPAVSAPTSRRVEAPELEEEPLCDSNATEGVASRPRKVRYQQAAAAQRAAVAAVGGDDDGFDEFHSSDDRENFSALDGRMSLDGSTNLDSRMNLDSGTSKVSAFGGADDDVTVDYVEEAHAGAAASAIDDVIVINIMARANDEISGNDLLRALLSVGLRFGDMNIFHRHEQFSGKGSVLFSAVNAVEPGTFDLNRMEDFKTPGICMFLRLPGPKRSLHAFEQLVECARKIGNQLGADLKDENHSVLTQQTVEHYRQRVLDFERKMMAHRAAR
ncbi:Probably cell division protein ZipA [gamma proteobacterium HdN1]|nr:Probably cell division protein ZipA [gamma proteobacterium HdN1]